MLKELQDFGLSEKEAKVYVAALELGRATVQQIAAKSKVNRATTYVQLESLKDQGLVTQIIQDKKTFFVAERPEKVLNLIEKQKNDILFKEKEFNKVLPNLKAIYNVDEDVPEVRYYEGEDAVNLYREELIKSKHSFFYSIAPILNDYEMKPEIEDAYHRMIKSIKDYKSIYVAAKRYPDIEAFAKKYKHFTLKYIPIEKFNIKTEIAVFDDKLWMNNLEGKPRAVLIQDKIMAASYKLVFERFWSIAE
ncbi:hypothetical protein COT97_03410 [Candidatus Falkowbacteria bacterium CG10_big_fil_rev_8_21_14_0_10_39_11]|uniref:Transcription regulator TrmB N-terminal domain-containing protein n=1 Tax=Candidatus Falkowbacteria bacterium CG10_big_fil_rev_8_21_14_0_10_39_11 TaxID=1974565 RepID=A0A2H0V4P7_9BACT|nr:MAG: hypothetical protein COT97_03410 [Candidatus Falkowbacteria bacterium CG10_big_fil_rev_8_21_14_0_10_39_11]